MKTKTIVLVEIAIVLCSMFLVALPAISANQNQEMQKMSPTEVTAASDIYEPGPLDVFGNANEDDTIDMRDTTYIKLVIFGKKPKTDLADANNDGKISMLDVGQTKLIILGKEKKLTFIDIFGEAVTVNKPINRLVNLGYYGVQIARAVGISDRIIAVGWSGLTKQKIFYPEIIKLPAVGSSPPNVDYEMILSLKPDAVETNLEAPEFVVAEGLEKKRMFEEKLPDIPLICLDLRTIGTLPQSLRTYGYIIDKEDRAEEFAEWIEEYIDLFKDRTKGLSEADKPRVYFETGNKKYHTGGSGCSHVPLILLAGGRNIIDDMLDPDDPQYKSLFEVDPEWVVEQNPEIILIRGRPWVIPGSYESDDSSAFAAARREILERLEFANVAAVKNERVYVPDGNLVGGPPHIITTAYMAKVFHPDLFKDIDPEAIHQEYIDKFCHIDFNVKEHGVFWYPPLE